MTITGSISTMELRNISTLLPINGKHHDAAQRLHAAILLQDSEVVTFMDRLTPKLLKHIAAESATFSPDELEFFLQFISSSRLIGAGSSQRLSRLVVSAASLLTPVMLTAVPVNAHMYVSSNIIILQHFLHCMELVWRNDDNVLWGVLTGTYMKLRKGDDVLLRSNYFRHATNETMPEGDAVWFATEWKLVLTVWDRLVESDCFTREYAETLIKHIDEHGPMLADGML